MIGTTTSMSLALSIFVFFISLMHSVDEAQCLNTTSLLLLPALVFVAATDIVYMHHCNHINLILTLKI